MKRTLIPLLTILLIGAILLNLKWELIGDFLRKAKAHRILLAYALYLLSFVARALRWKITLPSESMKKLFRIVAIHTMANNIYPARTGELSFLYLLGEYPKGRLTSILLAARIADICCIALFFSAATLAVIPQRMKEIAAATGLALAFAAILAIAACIASRLAGTKIKGFLKDMAEGLADQKSALPQIFAVSALIWGIKYTSFYILAKEILATVGHQISFPQAVFGLSFSELTTVLPIHSIGGFGTFEAGWTGAFMILGVEKSTALTTGFIFHSVLLIFSVATGAVSYLIHKARGPSG